VNLTPLTVFKLFEKLNHMIEIRALRLPIAVIKKYRSQSTTIRVYCLSAAFHFSHLLLINQAAWARDILGISISVFDLVMMTLNVIWATRTWKFKIGQGRPVYVYSYFGPYSDSLMASIPKNHRLVHPSAIPIFVEN
jgi:hypothetical protein